MQLLAVRPLTRGYELQRVLNRSYSHHEKQAEYRNMPSMDQNLAHSSETQKKRHWAVWVGLLFVLVPVLAVTAWVWTTLHVAYSNGDGLDAATSVPVRFGKIFLETVSRNPPRPMTRSSPIMAPIIFPSRNTAMRLMH